MNISALFIHRPIATTLLMAGVLVAGIMAYLRLPVDALPTIDYPTIVVNASMPGAGAETMAASIATPLEKRLSTIAGLDSITSVNSHGSTRITLQFNLNRNIDAAAQDVQTALGSAQRSLPKDLPTPPSMYKVNPADSPVFYISLASETMRASDVSEYAENFMAQRLSMLQGVAQVSVYGSQKYAVRVEADPEAMAAVDIGIDEVARAISSSNTNLPVGLLSGERREYTLQSSGKLMNAEEFRPLIVAWRNGAPLRLREIALVRDGVENDRRRNWHNGTPSMLLAIQRQPGANTVEVVDRIKALLPELRAQIPPAISMTSLFDRSESIRESVHDVKFTMLLTIILVILVIFIFLRDARATIIPSLAVPLSIIGACGVMYLNNFSLNNISLMALTLSVGFVVDDAIVMLENIVRHLEQGRSPLEAALEGSKEIGFTILSMTVSLVAVFIPVLFLGGLVGRLFYEFAVSIAAAITVSGLVALTLTPMLCSRFLRPRQTAELPHARPGPAERLFDLTALIYERSLSLVMRYKRSALLCSFGIILFTAGMFIHAPKGFLPFEDTGAINISCEILQGSSFEQARAYAEEVSAIVRQEKDLLHETVTVGPGGPQASMNIFSLQLRMRNKAERNESIEEIILRLRLKLAAIPGVRSFVSQPPPLRLGASTRALYQLTLQSPDTQTLYLNSDAFMRKMADLPGLIDVNSDLQMKNPELRVEIDRARCAALGLTPSQVEEALAYAYGTRTVSTILAPTNDYPVILELKPEFRGDINALNYLHVRSSNGRLVPLRTVVKNSPGVGPLTVNHTGQMNSVTISFNLTPGFSIGQA
ncbi:MAG: efflux RND transporter permease subunit, partial [Deltaproteobacteria bacterium]|nr:efflux RND transporter permease subunit [Deltaproteobacteria bacterium]